jgi:hypothetical protein
MQKIGEALGSALEIEGALAVGLGDWKSGMCLGSKGTNSSDFPDDKVELAIALNTEVVRSKMRAIQALEMQESIEEILIILGKQYHLIRLTKTIDGLFFYVVLDREKSNLAFARIKLNKIESELKV